MIGFRAGDLQEVLKPRDKGAKPNPPIVCLSFASSHTQEQVRQVHFRAETRNL
jgi:hypothetical protein